MSFVSIQHIESNVACSQYCNTFLYYELTETILKSQTPLLLEDLR